MAAPCGLTHEQTSPQHHARSRDTLYVSLLDLLQTHTCQNTMWTAQTECWWEQTLHHHTHFTHYTSNFSISLYFNSFNHVHYFSPSLLSFSLSLLCLLFRSHRAGFSLVFQPDRQMSPGRPLIYTVTLNMINSISQEVHLQNQPADIIPDLKTAISQWVNQSSL